MLGRPGIWLPVWMNVIAGSWLIASVFIVLTMAEVVDDARQVRQQLADPGAVLAVLVRT